MSRASRSASPQGHEIRIMERIRRSGHWFLIIFLVLFVITLFFGLTGGFNVNPFRPNPTAVDNQKAQVPTVVQDKDVKDVAVLVNGRKVSESVFNQIRDLLLQQYGGADANSDPTTKMRFYQYALGMVTRQEVLMAEGERLGLKMNDDDWQKAEDEASQSYQQAPAAPAKAGGNIIGDTFSKLSQMRNSKAAFEQYLSDHQMSEGEWKKEAYRDLFTKKVTDHFTDEANAAKKAELEKKKADIDKQLAAGKDFAELAKKLSEGQNANTGGDLGEVGRGLLDKKVSDKLFTTAVGKTTDWLEIPAGFQKFKVDEKKAASGPEFEAAKPALLKQIRSEKKSDKYEPTADQYKEAFEKVHAHVIELHNTDPQTANKKMQDLVEAANVEVNDPFALAAQALYDSKLQPPASVGYDQLVTFAKLAPVGDGYDFGLIQKKLAQGHQEPAKTDATKPGDKSSEKPGEEAKPGAAPTGKAGETKPTEKGAVDLSGAAKMTDSAATTAAATGSKANETGKSAEKITTPIYALAAGLIEKAIKDNTGDSHDTWPRFIASKIYLEWMKDEAQAKAQPVKTVEARAKVEELLAAVTKSDDYNAAAHAWRGLNLAWLGKDKKKDAEGELAKAMQYAPSKEGDVWDSIKKGYQVLDESSKVSEVDAKLSGFRQQALQEQIKQAMAQQGNNGGKPMSINFPPTAGGKK